MVSTPDPPGQATYTAVSCTSTTACTAVGQIWTTAGIGALADGWAPAVCTAVGSRQTSQTQQLNLVESEPG